MIMTKSRYAAIMPQIWTGNLDLSRREFMDNGGPHSGANAGQLSISMSQKPVLWKRLQDRVVEAGSLGVGVPF